MSVNLFDDIINGKKIETYLDHDMLQAMDSTFVAFECRLFQARLLFAEAVQAQLFALSENFTFFSASGHSRYRFFKYSTWSLSIPSRVLLSSLLIMQQSCRY